MNAGKFVGVCAERCTRCLFGDHALVPDLAREAIVGDVLRRDSYFTCHQATERGVDAMCRGWWDELRHATNAGRMAERLGIAPGWRPSGLPTDTEYAAELRGLSREDWGSIPEDVHREVVE